MLHVGDDSLRLNPFYDWLYEHISKIRIFTAEVFERPPPVCDARNIYARSELDVCAFACKLFAHCSTPLAKQRRIP